LKVIDHLNNATRTPISFEILPPVKGKSIQAMYRILDQLTEYNPSFINVTYHRSEYKYKLRNNGLYEKVNTRKRPGTVGICASIKYKYGIDTVPHLVCGGFSKNETEDALLDLNYLGIDNVLLLRGDAVKLERTFVPEPDGNRNALELVEQTVKLNNGVYLEEDLVNGIHTNFCIGVAGYPEKHAEAPNMKSDLEFLKRKIDAGADYVVTQMFFDNQKYINFVQACRKEGITVPIIPGLKPLTKKAQLYRLPGIFNINMPDELVQAVRQCKTDKEARKVGIEWTIQQCKELMEFGAPCLHFYTMSFASAIKAIMKGL